MSFIGFDDENCYIKAKGKLVAFKRSKTSELVECESFNGPNKHEIVDFLGIYEIAGVELAAVSTQIKSVSKVWGINTIYGFQVYQITKGPENVEAIALLKSGLSLSPLYYSEAVDLSLNQTLQLKKAPSRQHFIWNGVAIKRFEEATKVVGLCQPIVAGFITTFATNKFEFVLISRRDAVRAGTRFWMRGADENGNVANFVETEQIVHTPNETYSFVQIRGSVPLHWTQYPDLSRLPKIRLDDREPNREILNKHFKRITDEYGRVVAVSLTDHKGKELELTNTYNEFGGQAENVHFEYFDFHKECSKMRYQNIDKLIANIADELEKMGWSEAKSGKLQDGVVRTNCVDCLDRTNVVQTVIARKILDKQLEASRCECDYLSAFRNAWTDNADAISKQYAGTPALKTDYTRTGKRSTFGALNDGKNSILRYKINTCDDGDRQDQFDAVTQAVPIKSLSKENLLIAFIFFIILMIQALVLTVSGKKVESRKKVLEARMRLVNSPRFREIKPAEKNAHIKAD